jgi:hypothetical protein
MLLPVKILAKLTSAIENKRVILVRYDGLDYIVEPYVLYHAPNGNWIVHTYKTGGDFKDVPGPHWANLRADKIEEVHMLNRRWKTPHDGYKPDGIRGEVLCATAVGPPAQQAELGNLTVNV